MRINIFSILVISILLSGCLGQGSIIPAPKNFAEGFTDSVILEYAGELKQMGAEVIAKGAGARLFSDAGITGTSIASGLLGVGQAASQATLGILSIATLGLYKTQDLLDAKGKVEIALEVLQRIEKAELKYARAMIAKPSRKKLTQAGLDLYEEILKTKRIVMSMLLRQIPDKRDMGE